MQVVIVIVVTIIVVIIIIIVIIIININMIIATIVSMQTIIYFPTQRSGRLSSHSSVEFASIESKFQLVQSFLRKMWQK